MEPFGLLNLLKSLLPQAENITQNDETGTEESAPVFNAETPTDAHPVTPSTGAFLDFVSRHDARKKNIKK